MNLYKNCIVKTYVRLVIDATLPSDNPLRFRKCESLEKNVITYYDTWW